MNRPVLPGATVGVLGSGQLGRMFALAARRMGYRVHTFSPDQDTPTGQVADLEITAAYDDLDALRAFARGVSVLTFEFENVPASAAAAAEEETTVRPRGHVLYVTQQRLREKTFLAEAGLPVAPFVAVRSREDLERGLGQLGYPAVLKRAAFGYDGKGQVRVDARSGAAAAFAAVGGEAPGGQDCILEAFVPFVRELSVIAARSADGTFVHYGVVENVHRHHILDISVCPAAVSPSLERAAADLAREVLERLEVVGVLCVEMFEDAHGALLVNELAPRPHNSGHFTIDACVTNQFEQQLRAVCGLALGSPEQLRPAAMANLLGDLWQDGEPDWAAALRIPGVKLHLYGKRDARPGRKMGHLTVLAGSAAEARARVQTARAALVGRA